jgi:hypothetical protein
VFTVTGYSGDPTCTATESPIPTGYDSTGTCQAALSAGECTITNTSTPAPTITVDKSANPITLPEPGGSVTFTVRVDNTSPESLTLTSLTDTVYGNLNNKGTCSTPQTIAVSGFYQCSFSATVSGQPGNYTNTVTAQASDNESNTAQGSDSATVTITDVLPSFTVNKSANPITLPEPGGSVTFTVRVDNTSPESLTLTSLTDSIHGNLNNKGTCSTPQTIDISGSYQCSFSATVSGNAGHSETNTVTATAKDDENNSVQHQDDATVTITDVLPTLTVAKSANPITLPEPGGSVTFTVVVGNASQEALTLTSLIDSIHGNLNGQGTCSTPQTIAVSRSYQCSFSATVSGNAGYSETNTVTATAKDDENNSVQRQDDATVTIVLLQQGDIAVGLCKDEDIGDTHDVQCSVPLVDQRIPASLPMTFPVEITANPGAVSQKVKVALTIVSHDPCTAEWVAQTGDTEYLLMEVGATNLDRLDFTTPIIAAPTVYTRNYRIHCTVPNYYPQNIQITASGSTANVPPIGDPNESNNTAENRVDVTVSNIPDVDNDTIPNVSDNCPWVWNPDQLNADGDGLGDACDPDDDNDGILDGPDACDTAAEDFDGEVDGDGCPDSDASGLLVTRVEPVAVDVSENRVESVSARIQNGNHLADIDFTLLLVSVVSNPANKCEARWIAQPGDAYVEDIIDGKLFSQLEATKANVPPEAFASVTRSYTVHCNAPSYHSVILEVSALPAPPVIDPNVQNGNVFKDLSLEIEASALADLKKVGISVFADDCHNPPPTQIQAGVPVQLCIAQTYHNNGPYGPVQALDRLTISGPADCKVDGHSLPWSFDANPSLPVSVDVTQDRTVTIVCQLPSSHTFQLADVLSVNQLHVRDPNAANNTKSATWAVEVPDDEASVTVAVDVDAPTDAYVSEDELFNVTKTFTYSGIAGTTVEPEVDQVMQPTDNNADECQVSFHVTNALLAKVKNLVITKDGVVVNPPTPYGWEASDVVWGDFGGSVDVHYQIPLAVGSTGVVEEWDKHCVAPSYHSFSLTTNLERNPAKDPHILYDGDEDVQTWVEEVWAVADLGIVDWFFMDIPLVDTDGNTTGDTPLVKVAPSSWKYGHEKEVIHNNGPYGPVDFTKVVTAQANGSCAVSYNVIGNEAEIKKDGVVVHPAPGEDVKSADGGTIQVTFAVSDLEVSVDFWEAELWDFHIADQTDCTVHFHKDITSELHVNEPLQDAKPNHAEKTVIVCADTDGDTVADNCPTLGEHDNCKYVKNADQKDSDGDGMGDACDSGPGTYHDVGTKSCLVFGPAPANIGDTTGRYMWVICDVRNLSDHAEQVSIELAVDDPPAECTEARGLILPSFEQFWMQVGEQKWVLYRVRYECSGGNPGVYPLDVSMCITHTTSHADGGHEIGSFLLNNCWNGVRNLIVHSP